MFKFRVECGEEEGKRMQKNQGNCNKSINIALKTQRTEERAYEEYRRLKRDSIKMQGKNIENSSKSIKSSKSSIKTTKSYQY
jgi:hypothetical protein